MFEAVQGFIVEEIGRYGYLAVFVLMVLESACVPIPSEVTMLFGGALASPGFTGPGRDLDLVAVGLIGAGANLVGSWIAYGVGWVGGLPLARRWGRYVLIQSHEIDRAHVWFERHGEAAVFFSRLLPVIRTFISLPAGVARMPFGRFSVYTLLGCLPWTFALATVGFFLGENWAAAERVLRPASWAIAVGLLLGVAWYLARRIRALRATGRER